MISDVKFATNVARCAHREVLDTIVADVFCDREVAALAVDLDAADIAFGRVNETADLMRHPHLRRVMIGSPAGPIGVPAPASVTDGHASAFGPVPALGEHSVAVRREFMA